MEEEGDDEGGNLGWGHISDGEEERVGGGRGSVV